MSGRARAPPQQRWVNALTATPRPSASHHRTRTRATKPAKYQGSSTARVKPGTRPTGSPHDRTGDLGLRSRRRGRLAIAARAPPATTVLGLMAFGVLHNVPRIALRHRTIRAGAVRPAARGAAGLITAIVPPAGIDRCGPAGPAGGRSSSATRVLAAACVRGARATAGDRPDCCSRPRPPSLTWPVYHFRGPGPPAQRGAAVLPVEARRLPTRPRGAGFWAAGRLGACDPALLLTGAFDRYFGG